MQDLEEIQEKKRRFRKCLLGTILFICIVVLLLFVIIFVILPVVFKYSGCIQRALIFPTWAISANVNYSDIDQFGIKGVKNFYVTVREESRSRSASDDNITLGVWQILPTVMLSELIDNDDYNYEGVLNNGHYNILIFLHGNGQDRSGSTDKFLILRDYFHIFCVDYRGYGDSTKAELTETGVVNDIVQFYEWIRNRTSSKIFVWGHSLGTGVGTHLLSNLKRKNIFSKGLILETPFTSVTDVMAEDPVLKNLYGWLPWFRLTILQPMKDNDLNFDVQHHITNVDSPIMILHAKDDSIIPYSFASKLNDYAVRNRYYYQGNVTYHLFEALGYDHMYVHRAPELPQYIEKFIEECDKFEKKQ